MPTATRDAFLKRRFEKLILVAHSIKNPADLKDLSNALESYFRANSDYDEELRSEFVSLKMKNDRLRSRLNPEFLNKAYQLQNELKTSSIDCVKWNELLSELFSALRSDPTLLKESETLLWLARSVVLVDDDKKNEIILFLWKYCSELSDTVLMSRIGSIIEIMVNYLPNEYLKNLRDECPLSKDMKSSIFLSIHQKIHKDKEYW